MYLLFLYSCILSLICPLLLGHSAIVTFAPFLILCYYRQTLFLSLGWSLLCGIFIDLFSDHMIIGITAINYFLVTLCLYRTQFYFFEHRLSSLPTMVVLFTLLSTSIYMLCFKCMTAQFALSWKDLAITLMESSISGIFYTLVAFSLPQLFFRRFFSMNAIQK